MEVKNQTRPFTELEMARLRGRAEALTSVKVYMFQDFNRFVMECEQMTARFPGIGEHVNQLIDLFGKANDQIVDYVAGQLGINIHMTITGKGKATVIISADQEKFFNSMGNLHHQEL